MQRSKDWITRVESCLSSIHWWKTSLMLKWNSRKANNQVYRKQKRRCLIAWLQCLGNKNHRARCLHKWHLAGDREAAQLSRRKPDHSKRQTLNQERIWVNYAARRLIRIDHSRVSLRTSIEQLLVHSSKLNSKTQWTQIKRTLHQASTTKPQGKTSRRTS